MIEAPSPVKRQYGKKKEKSHKEIVDFTKYNIEDLLLEMGVEFRNPEKVDGGWLPLEAYDDKEFDTRNNEDWVSIKKVKADGSISLTDQSQIEGVSAQGLWKDRDGLYYWRRAKVLKYLPRSERFEGYWDNTKERCRLPRIFVLFDDEDPRIFSRRFKKAYENRE